MIHLCSIPELLHRYIDCYFSEIIARNYDIKEATSFLRMVCRKERKLEWTFKQKEKGEKNKDLAFVCGVDIRWFQKLYAEYKMFGKIPRSIISEFESNGWRFLFLRRERLFN